MIRNQKPYRVQIYQDDNSDWRWRLVAPNGKIVAVSGEGYKRRSYAEKIVRKIWGTAWELVV